MTFGFRTIVLIGIFCVCPQQAFADKRSEAGEQIQKGNILLAEGKYQEAITRFEIALKLSPELTSPYAGLGFAYQGLSQCEKAIQAFDVYLEKNPTGSVVKEVKSAREDCRNTLYCRVIIKSKPSGVAVYLGEATGEPLGVTPFIAEELKAGTYRFTLVLEGYQNRTLELSTEVGREYVVPAVTLEAIGEANKTPPPEPIIIIKEPDRVPLKRQWVALHVNPVAINAGLVGPGFDVSFLRRTNRELFAIGARTAFTGDFQGEFGLIELGGSFHWQPALSRTKRERLDLGIEAGIQLGGGEEFGGLGTYLRLRPGLAFHVGNRGLFSFYPISFGTSISFINNEAFPLLKILSFGYAFGF